MSACAHSLKWKFSTDRITFEKWTSYFNELANTKNAVLTEEPQYYVISLFNDPRQPAIYATDGLIRGPYQNIYPAHAVFEVN